MLHRVNQQFRLSDFPILVMVLGFGVASISIIGDRVYVTRIINDDVLRHRTGVPEHLDVTWTEEATGYEREAVLRHVNREVRT